MNEYGDPLEKTKQHCCNVNANITPLVLTAIGVQRDMCKNLGGLIQGMISLNAKSVTAMATLTNATTMQP